MTNSHPVLEIGIHFVVGTVAQVTSIKRMNKILIYLFILFFATGLCYELLESRRDARKQVGNGGTHVWSLLDVGLDR